MKNPFTRFSGAPFLKEIEAHYREPHRHYHNWDHIRRGFQHCTTFGLAYDPDLDLAWLGHDLIYDDKPGKEIRSIDRLREIVSGLQLGVNMDRVASMIESTIDHISNDERILIMDLGDLTDPTQTAHNHRLIRLENMELYGIDEETATRANLEFMTGFRQRLDHKNGQGVWTDILNGIDLSIQISKNLLEG